ncbi:hypothetical protein C7N43_15245 [Sphingobacteriales bacterium UPWRP_1]|nr:hypothetical protein BVG80_08255 [Sphingobacteriales bacterium TSM_CSM]PSJ76132.1 hypothetical protein C7N43_15245 [Sphingobacteriales bacterium UPWRP_1]
MNMKQQIHTLLLLFVYGLAGILLPGSALKAQPSSCPSYSSAYPPPFPASYPCMSAVLIADPYCCNNQFDAYCVNLLRTNCDGNSNLDTDCYVETCTPTGCAPQSVTDWSIVPLCFGAVCNSYSSASPPPGPNPPIQFVNNIPRPLVNGALFEIFQFDGFCCQNTWDSGCQGLMDSIACLICGDGNANTIDAANELLGCTHTPIPATLPNLVVKVKVILEGAYLPGTGAMKTNLRTAGVLPASQPFTAPPFNYTGTEGVANASLLPANAVDWVLLEFRNTLNNNLVHARKAGILLSDGTVANADGSQFTVGGLLPNNNYYIVIRSRNHLAVMSAYPIYLSSTTVYNFSSASGQVKGSAQTKFIETIDPDSNVIGDEFSIYAMYAGDMNADGSINVTDFNTVFAATNPTVKVYARADLNFDTYVTFHDYNAYISTAAAPTSNIGKTGITQVQSFPAITSVNVCP